MKTHKKGFTLIELLLVIGIIAILAAIVIVAINPTRQLGQARNSQRNSDVNTLLNAVWQYAIDNNGSMPCNADDSLCVNANWKQLGTSTTLCAAMRGSDDVGEGAGTGTAPDPPSGGTYHCDDIDDKDEPNSGDNSTHLDASCMDLSGDLGGTYVVSIPSDPRYGDATTTRYVIKKENSRVTVRSCYTEASLGIISVQR